MYEYLCVLVALTVFACTRSYNKSSTMDGSRFPLISIAFRVAVKFRFVLLTVVWW